MISFFWKVGILQHTAAGGVAAYEELSKSIRFKDIQSMIAALKEDAVHGNIILCSVQFSHKLLTGFCLLNAIKWFVIPIIYSVCPVFGDRLSIGKYLTRYGVEQDELNVWKKVGMTNTSYRLVTRVDLAAYKHLYPEFFFSILAIAIDDNIAKFHMHTLVHIIPNIRRHHRVLVKKNSYGVLCFDRNLTDFLRSFYVTNDDQRHALASHIVSICERFLRVWA